MAGLFSKLKAGASVRHTFLYHTERHPQPQLITFMKLHEPPDGAGIRDIPWAYG
jgi:hypothetical protein